LTRQTGGIDLTGFQRMEALVLQTEQWMDIHLLFKQLGSIRAVVKQTVYSRNTVRKRRNRHDSFQLHQHLPPTRPRPAGLLHTTADESADHTGESTRKVAARPMAAADTGGGVRRTDTLLASVLMRTTLKVPTVAARLVALAVALLAESPAELVARTR